MINYQLKVICGEAHSRFTNNHKTYLHQIISSPHARKKWRYLRLYPRQHEYRSWVTFYVPTPCEVSFIHAHRGDDLVRRACVVIDASNLRDHRSTIKKSCFRIWWVKFKIQAVYAPLESMISWLMLPSHLLSYVNDLKPLFVISMTYEILTWYFFPHAAPFWYKGGLTAAIIDPKSPPARSPNIHAPAAT